MESELETIGAASGVSTTSLAEPSMTVGCGIGTTASIGPRRSTYAALGSSPSPSPTSIMDKQLGRKYRGLSKMKTVASGTSISDQVSDGLSAAAHVGRSRVSW